MRPGLFPLKERAQQALQIGIDWAQDSIPSQESRNELLVGEKIVEHRQDEKAEINRQFPCILQGKRLLVAQAVIADRIAGNVRFVHHPLHQLRSPAAVFELSIVSALN